MATKKKAKASKSKKGPNYREYSEHFWNKGARGIYSELKKAGLSNYQIAGILGSIAVESSFDPNASNGTHWGYIQNSKDFVDAIKKYYRGYGHKEQLQFLLDGLSGKLKGASGKNKNSSMYQLQQRFNDYVNSTKNLTNPVDTARAWEKFYEKSGGQAMGARQAYSQHFYDLMGNSRNTEPLDATTLNNLQKVRQLQNTNLIDITQPNDAIRVLPRPNLNIMPTSQIDTTPVMYNDLSIPITPGNINDYAYTRPIYNTLNNIPIRQKAFNTETPEVILPNFDFYNLNLGDYLNNG